MQQSERRTADPRRPREDDLTAEPRFWSPGEALAWVGALVFMLSSFMGWYSGTLDGVNVSVTGWDTGTIGKLVFFVGLAVLFLLALRALGFQMPSTPSLGVATATLGTAGTILVLIRAISIPDDIEPTERAVGLWISLAAGALLIVAGLLKESDDV